MSLLSELRDKIKAVGDAYDIPYDGDEGAHTKAVIAAGIDLDDFVMLNADELVAELTLVISAS